MCLKSVVNFLPVPSLLICISLIVIPDQIRLVQLLSAGELQAEHLKLLVSLGRGTSIDSRQELASGRGVGVCLIYLEIIR